MSTFRPLPDGRTYAVTGMKRDAITGRFITTAPVTAPLRRTHMTAATAPLSCVCLTPRRRTAAGYLICPNCDMVQEQETQTINGQPGKRKTTLEDRRFHLAWEVRKRAIYGS